MGDKSPKNTSKSKKQKSDKKSAIAASKVRVPDAVTKAK